MSMAATVEAADEAANVEAADTAEKEEQVDKATNKIINIRNMGKSTSHLNMKAWPISYQSWAKLWRWRQQTKLRRWRQQTKLQSWSRLTKQNEES